MKKILSVISLAALSLSSSDAIERLTPIKEPEIVPAPQKHVKAAVKAWLGVAGHPVSGALAAQLNISHGVTLELVDPQGAAAQAGISKFDIITEIGDLPIRRMDDIRSALREAEVDSVVEVKIFSKGKVVPKKVKLVARPAHLAKFQPPVQVAPPHAKRSQQKLPQSLQHLPANDRERIERMMANQLQQFEKHFSQMDMQMGGARSLREKMQRMTIDLDDMRMKGHSNYSGTFTMMDNQGSICLKSNGKDGKHAVVKDTAGKILFSGPYETDEDKAAVPTEIRERIEALGLDKKSGAGLQFKFGK